MAIKSAGYDGTVDEVQFAGMLPKAGASEYGVDYPSDFKVTVTTGAARAVSIARGVAWGHSVVDRMDTNFTVQFDEPTSGTRYDMVVLRRNWQPPGGSTSIEVVKGGTRADILPDRHNIPGVLDEQPLALVAVRKGDANVISVTDLRCWGRNGGVYCRDKRVLQYLDRVGSVVTVDGDAPELWFRMINETGASAVWWPLHQAVNIMRLYDGNSGASLDVGKDGIGPFVRSVTVSGREYNSEPNMYVTSNGVIGRAGRPVSRISDGFDAEMKAGRDGIGGYIASTTVWDRNYSNSPNMYVTSNGVIGRSTANSSLREYKTNIRPAALAPAAVLGLEPVVYDRKDGSGENELGLIAQDVEKVVPGLALYEDGALEGVRYDRLAVALLEVVKDQEERIRALEKRPAK